MLNIDDGRRAELTESGLRVMHELANEELEIIVEDIRKAVKKLKEGKLPVVDGITSEMLKCGAECFLKWLRRVCNVRHSVRSTAPKLKLTPSSLRFC